MKPKAILILVAVLVALVLIFSSAYRVREWEQVVITQFGEPVGDAIAIASPDVRLGQVRRHDGFTPKTPGIDERAERLEEAIGVALNPEVVEHDQR